VENFARQQFDLLLHEAAGTFYERIVHRCGGPQSALERLRDDPESEGVWLSQYVDVLFEEHLLNSPGGACFVLDALAQRSVANTEGGKIADVLARLARLAFAEVLAKQTSQILQRQLAFVPEREPS